ncbi:hypothetical protein OG453_07730 [Streptomyces sp. NBC_01381]|uniref:hypothetical protein n=1 Tax=Streptomyces sp. NBC_01381 TaxID=2903845 RepID=UPI00224ED60C|nr:hypothetical protein [Streptomyces sp. NBC_01381]MCX4666560.1 hypothetical protein [Streptomyces sp. NBC_01381]
MLTAPAMVEAFDALGVNAPECETCEGTGIATYLHGPYARTRECDTCHGAGHRLPCPHCTDGVTPGTEETCPTCDGYASLY